MSNKFNITQSTFASGPRQFPKFTPKQGQSALKNPFNQTLPLKFPQNRIIKQCSSSMLDTTTQKRHVSSVRNFHQHNRSKHFQGYPHTSHSEIIGRHPQHHFDSKPQHKLSMSGQFGYLARQSVEYPVRLRTYEDIGAVNNSRRANIGGYAYNDPITAGIEEKRFNSSLERTWREERRFRDHGVECQKVVQWQAKPKKREPYGKAKESRETGKTNSYKEMYLKARNLK